MTRAAASDAWRPRRSLGQNFLVNAGAIDALITAFAPSPDDVVLEVGPGRGALTRRLAGRVRRLVAVEIDPALARALAADLAAEIAAGVVTILERDILAASVERLLADAGATPARRARLIANLPYGVATAVITRCFEARALLGDLLVMVQREVAARILAAPGGRTYGGLSVLCQVHARGASVLRLRPGSFRPVPRVESEALRLVIRDPPLLPSDALADLPALLRHAFATRRKTLVNNLARLPSSPARGDGARPAPALGARAARVLIARAGLDAEHRPERVPVEGFLDLLLAWRRL